MLPQGWADLFALLDGRPDDTPMTRLKRLCALSVEATGVSGSSVSLTSASARSTVCATDSVSDDLEDLQDTIGEGPAVDAARDARAVLVPDLAKVGRRWPGFAPSAWDLGVRAMFVLPLGAGALRLGTLAMYRAAPGALGADQLREAWTLVDAASVLLTVDQPEDGTAAFVWVLGDESRFRPEVHQAVGATMVHLGVGPREAFARLCAYAYASDTSMAAVAGEIMSRRLRLDGD